MDTKELYREILNEHNMNPNHRRAVGGCTVSLDGVNPSCGDNIRLSLKVVDGKIADGGFSGSGCAISQASCDMMLDLVIGKGVDEALRLSENFMGMIKGTAAEDEIEELDEASALRDIAHMPSRVKCAVLGWRTMREALEKASAGGIVVGVGAEDHAGCPA